MVTSARSLLDVSCPLPLAEVVVGLTGRFQAQVGDYLGCGFGSREQVSENGKPDLAPECGKDRPYFVVRIFSIDAREYISPFVPAGIQVFLDKPKAVNHT